MRDCGISGCIKTVEIPARFFTITIENSAEISISYTLIALSGQAAKIAYQDYVF